MFDFADRWSPQVQGVLAARYACIAGATALLVASFILLISTARKVASKSGRFPPVSLVSAAWLAAVLGMMAQAAFIVHTIYVALLTGR